MEKVYISFSEDMEDIIFEGLHVDINPVDVIREILAGGVIKYEEEEKV